MRILIFIALLCVAVQGRGQIYINSYRFGVAAGLLLDDYPGASVAYSFRKLRTAYTDDCIQVLKDSTGDATLNIGFVNNYLDTAALKTFCGTNTCRIRIWYDQSGNGRNISQTNKANQPIIYASNALIKDNSNVAAQFDGSTDFLQDTANILATNNPVVNFFGIAKKLTRTATTNDFAAIIGIGSVSQSFFYLPFRANSTTEEMQFRAAGGTNSRTINTGNNFTNNVLNLFSAFDNGSDVAMYRNNTIIQALTATALGAFTPTANTGFRIGHVPGSTSSFWLGNITEIILYTTDKSADRTGISDNINTFYSIY